MSEPVDVDASERGSHAPGDGSPLFTSVVAPPERPREKAPRWLGLLVAVMCVAILAGAITIGRNVGQDADRAVVSPKATKPFSIVATDQATVIAYTDPTISASEFDRAWRAAGKAIVASGLPFETSSSLSLRTIWLGATRSLTRGDVLAAVDVLDGMPHVLGVEAPTVKQAPYCGLATSARQDDNTRRAVNTMIGFNLGLQNLEYYLRTNRGRADVSSIGFLLQVDRDFRYQLAQADLEGMAASWQQQFLDDRALYDASLAAARHALIAHDDAAFDAAMAQSRRDRPLSSADLDRLSDALGVPRSTCSFTVL